MIKKQLPMQLRIIPIWPEEVTDNIYDGLQTPSKEAEQKLNQASVQIEQMQADVEQTIQEARVKADEAAKASLWGFVA